jgi:exo-beta-1,3-glucanase (GH17 family)
VLIYYRDPFWPGCSRNLTNTIVDIQVLSQITTRIRLYDNYCNQTALVLEAIKQTKTNIKVFPAIDVIDKDDVGYQDQKAALQLVLHTYGADNILGIIVGNEFMFKYIARHNSASGNDTVGPAASTILKAKIADIRQMLTSMSITVPVGTADAAIYFNSDLLSAVDFGCAFISRYLRSGGC